MEPGFLSVHSCVSLNASSRGIFLFHMLRYKPVHQASGGDIVHIPQRREDAAGSGDPEGPLHARQSFAAGRTRSSAARSRAHACCAAAPVWAWGPPVRGQASAASLD